MFCSVHKTVPILRPEVLGFKLSFGLFLAFNVFYACPSKKTGLVRGMFCKKKMLRFLDKLIPTKPFSLKGRTPYVFTQVNLTTTVERGRRWFDVDSKRSSSTLRGCSSSRPGQQKGQTDFPLLEMMQCNCNPNKNAKSTPATIALSNLNFLVNAIAENPMNYCTYSGTSYLTHTFFWTFAQ